MIRELRILPPLAIGRFGAAASPMDNYDAVVDPERPLGYRALRPAPTFRVDDATGAIAEAFVPEALSFMEDGKVRPVAPFLELWALTDGQLEPLTKELLAAEGADPRDVRWEVHVANLKAARRTGDADDRITADAGPFSDHERHALLGECPHFWPGKTIPLGHVRYIRPTDGHPEIRLRFTPAAGHVYGASRTAPPDGPPADPNVVDLVYDASDTGGWLGHIDGADDTPSPTAPGGIYYGGLDDPPASRGYLDDGCDGIVRATLALPGGMLSSYSRIGAGPPAYAPDALPIRTVADELEQALLGPDIMPGEATIEQAGEILRRAFETVRLMNTAAMNRGGMVGHDSARGVGRRLEPIMARSLVDDTAVENLHQSLLTALRSGTAPWFADVLRHYDEIGDLSDRGRRKMPAMMRGADGRHLTLTRRQLELFRTLLRGPIFPGEGGEP